MLKIYLENKQIIIINFLYFKADITSEVLRGEELADWDFDTVNEEIIIPDLPLNKWVNVIIRVDDQHQLDVYINGTLTKRHMLKGVPKQNYGDVYASMNGGFSGYTSELRYFDSALGTNRINAIVDAGPNMKMSGDDMTKSKPHYLSTRWYFAGANDMYNP